MSTVIPFKEAYETPWRFSKCGQEILDRHNDHVTHVDLDDPDEREFWRGILVAVNAHHAMLAALKRITKCTGEDDFAACEAAITLAETQP